MEVENKNYETVFIINPNLSTKSVCQIVDSVKSFILKNSGQIIENTNIGSLKMAYAIDGKGTGIYHFIEFTLQSHLIKELETLYRRNENIIRFIVCCLDKSGVEYNNKRRKGKEKIINNQKVLSLL